MSSELTEKIKDRQVSKAKQLDPIAARLEKNKQAIAMALPRFMDPDHFRRVVLTEIRRNPRLGECEPITVLASVMMAAQLGLEPGPLGQCYLIPRKSKKTGQLECNFQWGYKGLLAMAQRSDQIASVTVETVFSGDDYAEQKGDEAKIVHNPAKWGTERGEPIGYYAIIRTKSGGIYRASMSIQDVTKHAQKYSESYGKSFSPWQSNFDAMAQKTVLLRALKLAPMSIDFQRGLATDETTPRSIEQDLPAQIETDAMQEADATVVESQQ